MEPVRLGLGWKFVAAAPAPNWLKRRKSLLLLIFPGKTGRVTTDARRTRWPVAGGCERITAPGANTGSPEYLAPGPSDRVTTGDGPADRR